MSTPHTFATLVKKPIHFLAFGLGSGLINPAPGTWGTLLGTFLFLPLAPWLVDSSIGAIFLILTFIAGVYFCDKTARDIGIHDFGGIVWDEFVGVWLVLVAFPHNLYSKWGILGSALAAFLLFRLFDITKPWPIRWLDKYAPGGFGIMIDDVLAGIFALIPLWLLAWLL